VYINNIVLYTNLFYFIGFKIKTIEFNLYSIPCLSKDMTKNCIYDNYNFNVHEKLFEFNVSDIKCKL